MATRGDLYAHMVLIAVRRAGYEALIEVIASPPRIAGPLIRISYLILIHIIYIYIEYIILLYIFYYIFIIIYIYIYINIYKKLYGLVFFIMYNILLTFTCSPY